MPILLKKKFSIGDLAPEGSEGYSYATLTSLVHNGLTFGVMVEYEYGEASGAFLERWVKGQGSPTRVMDVPPQEVAAMWGQMPKKGESIGEAMRRVTYEYMIAHGVEGEIMNNPPLPPEEAKPDTPATDDAAVPEAAPEAAEPATDAPVEPEAGTGTGDSEPAAEPETEQPASEPPADVEAEQPAADAPAGTGEEQPAAEASADAEAEPVPSPS